MEHILGQGNKAGMGIPPLGSLPVVKCSNCGSLCFENVYLLRVLSAIQSPDGQELIIPEPTFRCVRCHAVMGGFSDTNKDAEEIKEDEHKTDGGVIGEPSVEDEESQEDSDGGSILKLV